MLEIVVSVKPDSKEVAAAAATKPPTKRRANFEELVTALESLGVQSIPNVDAVELGARRFKIETGQRAIDMRDLANMIKRRFGFRPGLRLLADTLREMRFQKFGR